MSRSVTAIASVLLLSLTGSYAFGQMDDPPVGSVVAWLKSFENVPALPNGWVECNGQVLAEPGSPFDGQTIPDLNGATGTQRFLRGSTSSGATGGSEQHNHTIPNFHPSGQYDIEFGDNIGPTTGTTSTLPSYDEVVWIIKVKSSAGTVPAVSEWGLIVMGLLILTAGTIVFIKRRHVRTT